MNVYETYDELVNGGLNQLSYLPGAPYCRKLQKASTVSKANQSELPKVGVRWSGNQTSHWTKYISFRWWFFSTCSHSK